MTTPCCETTHQTCIEQALQKAESLCQARGARLTPLRRHVLERVWASHDPVRAYDLIDAMNQAGTRTAPPTVYRALDFLVAQGLVHKLASINAYMGCPSPETLHRGCFLICRECQSAREIQPTLLDEALAHASEVEGFDISSATLEVSGLCQDCRKAPTA